LKKYTDMKLRVTFSVLLFAMSFNMLSAQTIIIIKAKPSSAMEATVSSVYPTSTGPNPLDFFGAAWTGGGIPGGWRAFFKFDFGNEATFPILAGLVIDSAFMKLYADTNSTWGYLGTPTYGTDNACVIYRVSSYWDSLMTWNTMPTFSTAHAGVLPQSTSLKQNYLHIDITAVLKDIITSGQNNGFMMKSVQETTPYNSMIFHSTHSVDSNVRPVIVVYGHSITDVNEVTLNSENITVSPNPSSTALTVNIKKNVDEELNISLLDVQGRVVMSTSNHTKTINATWTIDATTLAKGIYFVKVNSGEKMFLKS
jgi:hypothetical protein